MKPPKGGFFVPEIWLHQDFAIQHRHKKGRQLATFLNKGIEPPHAFAVNPLPATILPQSKTE
ncbi:Hypothetical protein ABZS17I87_02614 [Kosakonia cowanii]